MKGELI